MLDSEELKQTKVITQNKNMQYFVPVAALLSLYSKVSGKTRGVCQILGIVYVLKEDEYRKEIIQNAFCP